MHIATVAVYVEDQDAALDFWTRQVGFVLQRREAMGPDASWLEVGPAGKESCLVLYPRSRMKDWAERKPSVVFECDDLEREHAAMAGRGVRFTQDPKDMPWGPFAMFVDPEGNWYGLRQPRRQAEGQA